MIDTMLFDLDETIIDRTNSLEKFIESQYLRLIYPVHKIDFDLYKERFISLDNNGYTWKDQVYESLINEFSLFNFTVNTLLDDYLERFHESVVPMDNLYETLEILSSENIKIGIITNGKTDFQKKNIKSLNIEHYLDVIVVSDEVGFKKPQPEIFLFALDKLNADISNTLFVGDHIVNDIKGANNIGIKTLLFDKKKENVHIHNRIENLIEIIYYVKSPI
ncbi:HAD-IIIA family hydrolase [Macrococcoides canis]|uniref:HAD family hydrolase n=1 Tax=Macrococcoides canis TaxID=1855823 RepID=UPI001060727A|nr:HAD-IA family hydrolase [Macrococcus canis]TDM32809.1 HAD-IIIA family hydrolase [Macrococcus canis]TDM43363.1 HAD-IIIA family hydrolase [Macrococcus canis]